MSEIAAVRGSAIVAGGRPGSAARAWSGCTPRACRQAAVEQAAALDADGLRASVACAGIRPAARLLGRRGPHSVERFTTVVTVNLAGTFPLLRAAAAMAANEPIDGERGVHISTASAAAYEGQIGQVAYKATAFPQRLGRPEEFAELVPTIVHNPMINGGPCCSRRVDSDDSGKRRGRRRHHVPDRCLAAAARGADQAGRRGDRRRARPADLG